jgi:WD40 repeat protein
VGALSSLLAGRPHFGRLRLWSFPRPEEFVSLCGHESPVTSVVFSPDNRLLATVGRDKTVRLWDVATGERRATSPRHDRNVLLVGLTAEGRTLLTCDTSGIVRHWDVTGLHAISGQE